MVIIKCLDTHIKPFHEPIIVENPENEKECGQQKEFQQEMFQTYKVRWSYTTPGSPKYNKNC